MVREFTPIEYLVDGINRADGVREAVDVVEKLNDVLDRQQKEVDRIVSDQQNKNKIPENLVSSIREKVEGNAIGSTKKMADALERAVKGRITEANERGEKINNIVIDDNGIKAGNSRDDYEEER